MRPVIVIGLIYTAGLYIFLGRDFGSAGIIFLVLSCAYSSIYSLWSYDSLKQDISNNKLAWLLGCIYSLSVCIFIFQMSGWHLIPGALLMGAWFFKLLLKVWGQLT